MIPKRKKAKQFNREIRQIVDGNGKKVWVQTGIKASQLPQTIWAYDEPTGHSICQKIMEGFSIKTIGKMRGYPPPYTIYMWSRVYPEFRENLKLAREDQAHFFHDRVIEAAEEKTHKDYIPRSKLKVEAYKWAAGVNNKEAYGSKVSGGGGAGSVQIFIDTGVPPREEKEVESWEDPSKKEK